MFRKYVNKFQSTHFGNNWQHTLKHKEMIKNNFRATGDMNKAKSFVDNVHTYKPHQHFVSHGEHVIFMSNALAGQPNPAYAFADK